MVSLNNTVKIRAVYRQESGDTIRITIQEFIRDMIHCDYCKQGDILGYFFILRKRSLRTHHHMQTVAFFIIIII